MNKGLFLTLVILLYCTALKAQAFNGKNLQWQLSNNPDKRFKAFFGSKGLYFGSEGSSLVVENLINRKLIVKCKITIYDFCGNKEVRNITRTVKPLETAGTSTWFDGFDYSTSCTQKKKYSDTFYSKIDRVLIEVSSVEELEMTTTAGNTTKNTNAGNKPVSAPCNTGLPDILISETNEYYAKSSDGSYKKISKENYLIYKSKKTPEEKKRHILDCTGNKMQIDAKPYYD